EDRPVVEGGDVDVGRQPLALAERARPAGHVPRRRPRLRRVGEARALAEGLRSSCAATGTHATCSEPSTDTTSVLKSRAGSTASFAAASSPYDVAAGSCSYSCSSYATPASSSALIAGVAVTADTVRRVTDVTMDKIVSLCRRRGFVFPSSEIYGGLGSTYDYGHYGVLLKNEIRSRWLRT